MSEEVIRLLLRAYESMDINQLELVRDIAALARTNALEEAADAVGEVGDHAAAGAYIDAIRALITRA